MALAPVPRGSKRARWPEHLGTSTLCFLGGHRLRQTRARMYHEKGRQLRPGAASRVKADEASNTSAVKLLGPRAAPRCELGWLLPSFFLCFGDVVGL